MKKDNKTLSILQWLCHFNFGDFEKEEFKKFLRMGAIFALIIGVYWTLRPLKDAIFIQLVGKYQLPLAKTISVLALFPLVMLYSKILEKTSKEKMLFILPIFYSVAIFFLSAVIYLIQSEVQTFPKVFNQFIGFFWYLFVESFGSIVVACFWAFAADTTTSTHAKRGFPLVVAIGQIGGIIFPYNIGSLPYRFGHQSDTLSMMCLSLLIFCIIPLVHQLLKKTPMHLLQSFEKEKERSKEKTSFFQGLKLLLSHRYLLAIFGANFIYEVVITIFDFNFKLQASAIYSGVALSKYLSLYGSSVNVISLLCLLFGISNITRYLGVNISLVLMPIIVMAALIGFLNLGSLSFLFTLMVGSKAINYALNGPALKQLYIPTTRDVKFKAQAWIETFGSRSSKQAGSLFNMSLAPLQNSFGSMLGKSYYMQLSAGICFPILALWIVIALYLGKTFNHAIRENTTVC